MDSSINQIYAEMKAVADGVMAGAGDDYEQVIVVKTQDEMLSLINCGVRAGDYAKENVFIADNSTKLCAAQYVLCMWEDGTIDIPSKNFREKFASLSEDNKKAEVVLNNGKELCTKVLDIMK